MFGLSTRDVMLNVGEEVLNDYVNNGLSMDNWENNEGRNIPHYLDFVY